MDFLGIGRIYKHFRGAVSSQLNIATRGPDLIIVVNFILVLFLAPYLALYAIMGALLPVVCVAIQLFFVCPLIYILVKKQHLEIARFILPASVCIFALFGVSLGFHHNINIEHYFIPMGIIPFIIFDLHKRFQIITCLIFPVITWLMMSLVNSDIVPPALMGSEKYEDLLSILNLWGGYIATLVYFGMFYMSSIHFEAVTVHQSKMASLGEMASGLAHEINNPLSLILAQSEVLRQELNTDKIDKNEMNIMIFKIENTTDRIAKIIRGLLAFSRTNSTDPFESTSLLSLVNDTIELCQDKLLPIEVEIEWNNLKSIKIDCRQAQIQQVLVNLLINAKDAVQNSEAPWIKIEMNKINDIIEIAVSDSGMGIPQNIAQRIMEPFFTTKPVGSGTGLGLSLSKGLVESHGGTLTIDSLSRNTCFVVTLPISHYTQLQNAG